MSVNPNESINTQSSSQDKVLFSEKQKSLKKLSKAIDELSLLIIEQSQNSVLSGNIQQINQQLFDKLSNKELLKFLEEKEKQIISTSLQSVEFLLNRLESKEKEEISEMEKAKVKFQDIDRALMNATKQLKDIKNTLFAELEIKSEIERSKLEIDNIFLKEQEKLVQEEQKLKQSIESVNLLLDKLEQKDFSSGSLNETSLDLERIFTEEGEKVKLARKATEGLIDSLEEIKEEVSFSPEETEIFSSKLFQLKDSSNQCVLSFSQLSSFAEACTLFFKQFKNLVHSNDAYDIDKSSEKSKSCCDKIKETLFLVQEKLRSFGIFMKSLFVKLFSFLASSCTSACMSPLIMLRRGQRKKDLVFLESLFIEGKLSFGSSSVGIISRLKLFLKLFGLDLLVNREEGDFDYSVVVDISDASLSNTDSLSSMMLSLVKYFENFSFEELLLEIDSFSNEKAEEVEQILASRLEDLFAHNSWIFFESTGFSQR